MPSRLKFNKTDFTRAMSFLAGAAREGADEGMTKVVARAEKDAREAADWRYEGPQSIQYGKVLWEWENTGLARQSITGYVAGKAGNYLPQIATLQTTSRRNNTPLKHLHEADNSVTENVSPVPDRAIGVVTMNAAYAPFLQEWETERGVGKGNNPEPVTVWVFSMYWDWAYVPILKNEMEKAIGRAARRYT